MLKPYVGATVHYIPTKDDADFRGLECAAPYAAIVTKVRSDLDVDLVVFTVMRHPPTVARTVIPYSLKTDGAAHWKWIDARMLGETMPDPGEVEVTPQSSPLFEQMTPIQALPDALRDLMPGRGERDRLLLERWAQALETNSIDDTVLVRERVEPKELE